MATTPIEQASVCAHWIAKHPASFIALEKIALTRAQEGRRLCQMELYYLAGVSGVKLDQGGFVRNKNLAPALFRFMKMRNPELENIFEFRNSGLDNVDLAYVWRRAKCDEALAEVA